jgi:hypothetical protein
MGCESSVMILIGEIAVLQELKSDHRARGMLNVRLLVDKAKWILEALEREIERLEMALDAQTRSVWVANSETGKDYEICMATNIFACVAVVYLHTGKSQKKFMLVHHKC